MSYKLRLFGRIQRYGIWPGGPRRWWYFLRSIPWTSPDCLYLVIHDWAMGLSIQDYCHRHFIDKGDLEENVK